MSGDVRADDAFQLELEGTSTRDSGNGFMETVALLHAIGSEIQAPAGLRARRGALLARGHRSGEPVRPGGSWRRAPAVVLAAALTLLMVVGVGAATLGSRWLGESESDERPDVPMVLPDPEPLDEREIDSSVPSPLPAAHEPDEDDSAEAGESDSIDVDEGDPSESDSTEVDDGDAFELEESDSDADPTEPDASDSLDGDDAIAPDDGAPPDEFDPSESGDDATEPDGASED